MSAVLLSGICILVAFSFFILFIVLILRDRKKYKKDRKKELHLQEEILKELKKK
ncbi:hypothetical protein [Priestia megaterium]|uniref:hypothetical protein n=1 Tax=Priestia megaterium TaxID=1404 RepID=UPI00129347FC|nr:hypothetical protein [Priestia megaterium]